MQLPSYLRIRPFFIRPSCPDIIMAMLSWGECGAAKVCASMYGKLEYRMKLKKTSLPPPDLTRLPLAACQLYGWAIAVFHFVI